MKMRSSLFCDASPEHSLLIVQLSTCELFSLYSQAFKAAHGCGLTLVAEESHDDKEERRIPFADSICVPVWVNERILARLCVEPFRVCAEQYDGFDSYAHRMEEEGCSAAQVRSLRKEFELLPELSVCQRNAITTLLELFSRQLGEHAEMACMQAQCTHPESIRKAIAYIGSHLVEPLFLQQVAEHSAVSLHHFCTLFKKATGLTFTEFVNRARVAKAKKLLLLPRVRITDVAYDVGFRSLTQFNRSFRRITRQSPTEYRSHRLQNELAA